MQEAAENRLQEGLYPAICNFNRRSGIACIFRIEKAEQHQTRKNDKKYHRK